ncbi:adenosine kinase [Endozoicomonadaceae bacterium StTr2]
MKKYHVYGLGAALVDTEIQVDDAFLKANNVEKGLMTLVDQSRRDELVTAIGGDCSAYNRACGGSGANTAIAASCFGGNVFYSCRVAKDNNGDFFLEDMNNAGVETRGLRDEGITGKCLVLITPDAERSMNTFLGASETVSVVDLDKEALQNSQYLYIEGYQVTSDCGRAAAVEARKHAEAHGVKTALSLSDPSMVQFFRPGMEEMIGDGVDLIFANEEEALHWGETRDLNEAIESLKKIAKTFTITLGARGALVYDGTEVLKIEAAKVKAIDTNGAGDMFAGAFLYGITAGYSFQQAGDLASAAAGEVVSGYGPRLKCARHITIRDAVLGQ